MSKKTAKSVSASPQLSVIAGLPFHHATMSEALEDFCHIMRGKDATYWVTANVDFATRAPEDPLLKDMVFHAHRIFCDGLPLVWLSTWYGRPLPERVAGSDMVPLLLEICAREGFRVYFLGSDEGTLARASKIACERYPGLQIAGHHSPPFAKVQDWDNETIVTDIRDSKTDLILVAVGSPKQERWISGYLEQTGAKLAIGIGASLDFIAGSQTRAPRWVQRVGFEWLWRLLSDPKRLAKRYGSNFAFLGRAALTQWRLHRKAFPIENDCEDTSSHSDSRIDLRRTSRLTPDLLADLVSQIRQAHACGNMVPAVQAHPGMVSALTQLGLIPPLQLIQERTEVPARDEIPELTGIRAVVAPSTWRITSWEPVIGTSSLGLESIVIDCHQTTFIDFPTLLRLKELKLMLVKCEGSFRMVHLKPALEEQLRSLGFSELL